MYTDFFYNLLDTILFIIDVPVFFFVVLLFVMTLGRTLEYKS